MSPREEMLQIVMSDQPSSLRSRAATNTTCRFSRCFGDPTRQSYPVMVKVSKIASAAVKPDLLALAGLRRPLNDQPSLPFPTAPASPPGRFASPPVHDFAASLALSQSYADAPWWVDLYRKAFPTLISSVSVRDDGWAQRGGIDRVLTLACGRVYTVDEKVRTSEWPDILLEQWSDEERRIAGWVQKPLACDFIAYAFAPSQRGYLLPVALLQRAWRLNGRRWIEQHGQRRAHNRGYVSTNVPVPIPELKHAVIEAMLIG